MPVGRTYWVEKNMFGTLLENVRSLKNGEIEYMRFSIRCSFIHSVHPLGFIRALSVSLDGKQLDADDLYFVLRKNWIPVRCISTISDIWWNIGETAHIYIRKPGGAGVGRHDLSCTMTISTLFDTRTVDHTGIGHTISMTHHAAMTTAEAAFEEMTV